jgi:hypothetical protein
LSGKTLFEWAEILYDISLFQRFIRTVRPRSIITKSALKRIPFNERAANELRAKVLLADYRRRLSVIERRRGLIQGLKRRDPESPSDFKVRLLLRRL